MRTTILCLFISILTLACARSSTALARASETPTVAHEALMSSLAVRDYGAVERGLLAMRASQPDIYGANNYEYLLGRVLEAQGKWEDAIKSYRQIISAKGLLSEYAYLRLAEIAKQKGDYAAQGKYLELIIQLYPDSLLKSRARMMLVENYVKTGRPELAIPTLRARMDFSSQFGREAAGRLASIYLQLNRAEEGLTIFHRLLKGSKDDQALRAARALDEMDRKGGRRATELELITRARVYLFNRDSSGARYAYAQIAERFPNSPFRPEALYSIGRAYYIEDDFENAIKWYERVHDSYPRSPEGEQGFYQVGHALQNLGRYQDAIHRYKQMIDSYPKSDWLRGAHLNTIDSFRSLGKLDEALVWCDLTYERYGRDVTATTALFNKAKIQIAKNDYAAALLTLQLLSGRDLSARGPGATNRSEVEFLKAYCLEQAGRVEEAIDAYLAFPANRESFHGNRASLRLQALARAKRAEVEGKFRRYYVLAKQQYEASRYDDARVAINQALRLTQDRAISSELLQMLKRCYEVLPAYKQYNFTLQPAGRPYVADGARKMPARSHQSMADELIFLGLYDEGSLELQAALQGGLLSEAENEFMEASTQRRRASGRDWQYSLAVYLNRGGHAQPAIRYGESVFSSMPADYRVDLMPRDIAELLYPAPFRDYMHREATARGIDARYMLAIARQESRFNSSAKSFAAARGMFQFISSTAERVNRQLKVDDFDQSQLYDPSVAIRFAAAYMGELFGEFKNNPYAVAASYNGGELAVRRWLERARSSDPELFCAEVAYMESKDYVYKVMCNYWNYRRLYREDLNAKLRWSADAAVE